jgi:hypothetical protein
MERNVRLGTWKVTILKWIFRKLYGGMDQINEAQDTERWWAAVKTVMNLRVL